MNILYKIIKLKNLRIYLTIITEITVNEKLIKYDLYIDFNAIKN